MEEAKNFFWVIEELSNWINNVTNCNSHIRLVAGGPGSGKSSVAKVLASRLAKFANQFPIYIPLHLLNLDGKLKDAIFEFLRESQNFKHNPLENEFLKDNSILILDGLDELQMRGRAAQEVANHLIAELFRIVEINNSSASGKKIYSVIFGRDISIQSISKEFKGDGEIIQLLPYKIENNSNFRAENGILELDQRDDWWKNYGQLTKKNYGGLPKIFSKGEMGEVTFHTPPGVLFTFPSRYLSPIGHQ